MKYTKKFSKIKRRKSLRGGTTGFMRHIGYRAPIFSTKKRKAEEAELKEVEKDLKNIQGPKFRRIAKSLADVKRKFFERKHRNEQQDNEMLDNLFNEIKESPREYEQYIDVDDDIQVLEMAEAGLALDHEHNERNNENEIFKNNYVKALKIFMNQSNIIYNLTLKKKFLESIISQQNIENMRRSNSKKPILPLVIIEEIFSYLDDTDKQILYDEKRKMSTIINSWSHRIEEKYDDWKNRK